MADTTPKASGGSLTDEGKLRLMYLLMMHQLEGKPIKWEGFDAGTGHTKKALQNMVGLYKKQWITEAKPEDGANSVATAGAKDAPATPKKRGRAAKGGAEEGEPAAKKPRAPRKKAVKEVEEPKAHEDKGEEAAKVVEKTEEVTKNAEKVEKATDDIEAEKDERTDSIFGQPTKSTTPTPVE